jgi:uncharacterized membrane protein
MDKKFLSVSVSLVTVLAILLVAVVVVGNLLGIARFQTGENPIWRFVFVVVGLLVVGAVYAFTRENEIWVVGTREVVYMAIGAALFAVLSYVFNLSVFVVPSVSQVALRPAIAIPMFFGYAFGPVVGFFTGAVGNMFGDALTGFGLSPQWSIGNGLVGFISGLAFLFKDKKKSIDTVLITGAVLALLATVVYFLNRSVPNMMYFNEKEGIFGTAPVTVWIGVSILIGLVLVVIVRFVFRNNIDIAAAVTWGMLGNILGIGFAALSDIVINRYTLPVAVVGEFLPAAGPNLIFAAVLVPLLVAAYAQVQSQSGR